MNRRQKLPRSVVLVVGAIVFLFPFYYMVVGSLQESPDRRSPVPFRIRATSRSATTVTSTAGSTSCRVSSTPGSSRAGSSSACVLAGPAVLLFILFQRHFVSTNIGSGVKG